MIDFDKFYDDFISVAALFMVYKKEKRLTVFMTHAAVNKFKTDALSPPPNYIPFLFGRPVKIVEGDEARVYIGVELKGVNE